MAGGTVFWRRLNKAQIQGLAGVALLAAVGIGVSANERQASDSAEWEAANLAYLASKADSVGAVEGATGSIELPDLPIPANAVLDDSIHPARPFLLRGSAEDKARAANCLTTAIYYEAASEPDDGQRAVAQVILNRARHPAFPATVCGVIYQGSDKQGCQFSFACDGALNRGPPSRAAWARAARIADEALSGKVFAPVGMATHYHTYAVTPSWNRSLVMTGVQGAHFFHRWKGYWGTSAAFTQVYRGNEPFPGPLGVARRNMLENDPQLSTADAGKTALPSPAVPAARKVEALDAAVQPEYRTSGSVLTEGTDISDASGTVLDKWKDSGTLLR